MGCTVVCLAQQKFAREQLLHDADMLYSTIQDVHPYMFTSISKNEFEKELERTKGLLTDSMTVFDFYKMFAPLVSRIEDGHTELHYPFGFAMEHEIGVVPYSFAINKADTTITVRQGFEGVKIGSGSRILSINGIPAKELIVQASSMLSGESYHFKMERLNFLFSPLLYFILPSGDFQVEYLHNGKKETVSVQAKSFSEYVEVFLAPLNKKIPYSFSINKDKDIAVLSINSFDIYDNQGKEQYRNFLDSLFSEIKEKRINELVIDIRMNGGGLEELVWNLFQYISPVPFQTKGPSISKISETVKKEYDLEEPVGINLIGGEGLIPLQENPFRYSGNTYLLTSNFTFSSASKLAWAFRYFNMGKIIGEETGGLIVSYGNVFDTNLPNTNLPYGISRWKLYGYGATENQKHGVIPDIVVPAENAMDIVTEVITQDINKAR